MKKIILSLIALVALTTAVRAQDNTFGVRLGYGAAFGTELSYQGFISDINRIELDLGARFGKTSGEIVYPTTASLAAIYQWHWFLVGGLGIYGGPGVQLTVGSQSFGIGLGGQLGLDYQFAAPFQLSLDFRPIYHLIGSYHMSFDPHVALGIRYAF